MMWIMSGWTQVAESGWSEHREPVRTYIEADSMDEAFEKARAVYGDGIDTAHRWMERMEGSRMAKAGVPKSAGHTANPVTTICYGKADKWADRWDAVDFFTEGVYACEGSEQERYETILMKLLAGEMICSDEIG